MRTTLLLPLICSLALLSALAELVSTATLEALAGEAMGELAHAGPATPPATGNVDSDGLERPSATGPDAWVSIVGPGQITGSQIVAFTILYGNLGDTLAPSGTLTLTLSSGLGYVGADPVPTRWEPRFGWDLGDLSPMPTPPGITLTVTAYSFVQPGQTLSITAEIETGTMESVLSNNQFTQWLKVGHNLFLPCINNEP